MNALEFTLREVRAADEAFLDSLYGSTHGQQFTLLPLAPAQREALLGMQFRAQRTGYRQQYPGSQDFVILIEEKAVGRLWLDESAAEVLIVDIVIVPEQQGRGLGTAVLRGIIDRARQGGQTIRLQVDRMNVRAAQLYRRLGFQTSSGNEVFEEMELAPK